MADPLSSLESSIIGKDKAAVFALLGAPLKQTYWTNVKIKDDAPAAEVAAFKAEQLDEIWVYSNGSVHFSMDGKALMIDDDVSLDLPILDDDGTIMV